MDNTQIGAAVAVAIEASGQSRASIARQVHMDGAALSRSIGGERAFKSLELAWIADKLGVSVDQLIGRVTLPFMAAARATSSADAHVADEVQASARLLFERRRGLRQLGIGQAPSLPQVGPRATDYQVAAAIVKKLRKIAGPHPLRDVDELASAIETAFGIDVWVLPLPQGIDGYSVHAKEDGVYGIIATTEMPAQRIRFTIAHELAHLVLGDDTTNAPHSIDSEVNGEIEIERRANRIAGAALIPQDQIVNRDQWSAQQIGTEAFKFRVAPATFAARVRAHIYGDELPALSHAWPDASHGLGSYMQWQAANKVERQPRCLLRDLAIAYSSGEATVRPYAEVANIEDLDHARKQAREIAAA